MQLRHVRCWLAVGSLSLCSVPAFANMGNLATTYGVLPGDVASAQALSLFNSSVSATYYNPAYLTHDPRGELTLGLLHGEQDLTAKSVSGNGYQVRDGDPLKSSPTQHVLIGMKTDLTSITKYERPLYFGFMAGVEKYGAEMMAFNSNTSSQGQSLTYGREPLFLNLGGGLEVIEGLSLGLSARITLQAEAKMRTNSTLGGTTDSEEIAVAAKPSIRPIAGLSADLGKLLCSGDCWASGFEVAMAYRAYSNTSTKIDANAIIPTVINDPGLFLRINTLDSYQPDILALGVQYSGDRWRAGVTLEQQNWSDLGEELEKDTVKDQANLEFKDIIVPRIGGEFELMDNEAVEKRFKKTPTYSTVSPIYLTL
jgi:long-subunit fatty acid transport protein